MTEKKHEPLSFASTEAEIGNACRAAVVNRLGNPDLAKAPFRAVIEATGPESSPEFHATVTLWPKRQRKAKGAKP